MSDDDLDFVPDTPSPILAKKRKLFSSESRPSSSSSSGNDNIVNRVLKNSLISNTEDSNGIVKPLSLPGQNGFRQEREEAVKRKKEREHLSPFKSKSKGLQEKKSPDMYEGFVKSSCLLKTQLGTANTIGMIGGQGSIASKRKYATDDEPREDFARKRISSKNGPRVKKMNNAFAWPSSSESSSDEEWTTESSPGTTGLCSKCNRPLPGAGGTISSICTCSKNTASIRSKLESNHSKILNGEKSDVLQHKKKCKIASSKHRSSDILEDKTAKKKSSKTAGKSEELSLTPWHNYMADKADSPYQPMIPTPATPSPGKIKILSADHGASRNSQMKFSFDHLSNSSVSLPTTSGGYGTTKKSPSATSTKTGQKHSPFSSDNKYADNRVLDITNDDDDVICISPDDIASGSSRDQATNVPIHDLTMTPDTKKVYSQMQQMENDEEVARKLQEQLDMEFAMALQNQIEQQPTSRLNEPESMAAREEPRPVPPISARTRRRGRGRATNAGQPSHFTGEESLFQLMNALGSHVSEMDLNYLMRASDRSHGRIMPPMFMSNMMGSPSASGDDYEYLMNLAETIGDAKPKGLSKCQSNQLPVVTYKKQDDKTEDCNICMTEYDDGDSQKILPCFHSYHAKCIDKWIVKNATCPVCRVQIKLDG